ncbi:MAG: flagellar M-ring protein FliF [Deltaproteobacteria bacterium]|nr:flagellar M-ring protein FliF [Deltaproteobacteria bacterium]MBW1976402.1 flagellar M-ring protein FliF [Deltaproteobacteria bacterium]MBW2043320.1 flagellar M-ring protein FliF [Deltaproteobacteria bacterium]MBW2299388.1 flagellar M-ring protein FliF [Deltaproteobacteria bacterium]RLB36136.1 MAG: flagellar M-ring protein FliF [Deltaproteobacteria bacterium]
MGDSLNQFLAFLKSLPLSKKLGLAFTVALVIAGFALMFMWANKIDYQVLYDNLSPEDAGAIVSRLRAKNTPYKIEGNGTVILVPREKVYDLRLALATDSLPSGGNIGFEIFDKTDFRASRYVQKLNYKRALQGELARTINRFKEVRSSRVFVVLPKDSLFVEDSRPASASIQLDLRSDLPPAKLGGIVHLVASAVEGLDPEHVTVVDTKGRLLYKGAGENDSTALLSNSQLEYKEKVENEIRNNVQSMLEGIVGPGKAIVRVSAEIDFSKVTSSQEEYDPSTAAVRSKRTIIESAESGTGGGTAAETLLDRRRGVVPSPGNEKRKNTKKDLTTNYEINKTIKTILKPAGSIKHLSVAAVIDGTYRVKKTENGTVTKEYVPRTEEEMKKFLDLVKKAMGYSEDREDQVSVSSMPFSDSASATTEPPAEPGRLHLPDLLRNYGKMVINLFLIGLVFLLVVRPLLKSLKSVSAQSISERRELPSGSEEYAEIPGPGQTSHTERVREISKNDPEKTAQLLKGWISEQ